MGTGYPTKNGNERSYRPAPYRLADNSEITTTFIAHALVKYYHVDRVILIGTVKSMWEEAYKVFATEKHIPYSEEYYCELGDHCENANHNSDLYIPSQDQLEQVLGPDSKVVLVKYGITPEELEENASIILGIEKYINRGDEILVDITHSFRSLPLYIMNLLVYLKNVSHKNISITHITYGMLDVIREMSYAPVVELNEIMDINDWIIGAYSLSEFGNGYKVSDLLEAQNRKDISQRLRNFSDVMNLNHLGGIRNQIGNMSSMKNTEFDALSARLIPPIVQDFTKKFPYQSEPYFFQFRVAQWHFLHKNYASSYLALQEAMITNICQIVDTNYNNKEDREEAKLILLYKNPNKTHKIKHLPQIRKIYREVNEIRNSIAHELKIKQNPLQLIKTLGDSIQELESIWKDTGYHTPKPTEKCLINLSNHPSTKWPDEQRKAAEPYGKIIDIDFPMIDPTKDDNHIRQLAVNYLNKILNYRQKYHVTVHLMGEMNFTFTLLQLLQEYHIPCVASTTCRNVIEKELGQKITTFEFVQFRKYF